MFYGDSLIEILIPLGLPIFLVIAAIYGAKSPSGKSSEKPKGNLPLMTKDAQRSKPPMVPVKNAPETAPTPTVLEGTQEPQSTGKPTDSSVFHPDMPRMDPPK